MDIQKLLNRPKNLVYKVADPSQLEVHPEDICKNRKTNNIDVPPEFFWSVWNEYKNDASWVSEHQNKF